MMDQAYIALGTNLGDRVNHLKQAVELLQAEKAIRFEALSAVYETAPVGGPAQEPYLNACAAIKTYLSPVQLLLKLLELENLMGRIREMRWGPRIIDLDLLVYDEILMKTPLLELPHPRMCERDFVLVPLADIAPELVITGCNKSVLELLTDREPGEEIRFYLPRGWQK